MKVTELIASHGKTGFSFEVLPPLKGKGIAQLFRNIDILKEFNPLFINITTHRSEMVYKNTPDGLYQKVSERSRRDCGCGRGHTTEIQHTGRTPHYMQRIFQNRNRICLD